MDELDWTTVRRHSTVRIVISKHLPELNFKPQTTQTLLLGGGSLLVGWRLIAFSVRTQDVVVRSINNSTNDVIPPFRILHQPAGHLASYAVGNIPLLLLPLLLMRTLLVYS